MGLLVVASAGFGCAGGKVTTNGVPVGTPVRYVPAQVEIDVATWRDLDHVIVDLYGPQQFAKRGTQFAPDARQAGFVLKPASADGGRPYWEYFVDGRPQRFSHQPGLLILRGIDGKVSTAAVSPDSAGGQLYGMLWGAEPNLNHLRASDPNGLALPLIRVLSQADAIRNNPVFTDWYNGFQQWLTAESASAGTGPAPAAATTVRR